MYFFENNYNNLNSNHIKSIITQFHKTLDSNSSIFDTAISNDYKFTRYKVSKSGIQNIIFSNDIYNIPLSNKNVLIRYNGNPYLTLNLILLSLKNNFNILFLPIKKYSLNSIFIKVFNDILKNMRLYKSLQISTDISDNEIFKFQEKFDELIYIGNVYNYTRFKENINIPITYNGFGTLEVYVDDETNFSKELYELNKYIYENNLDIHYFHSTQLKKAILFENSYNNRYCFIIYSKDLDKAKKIASLINTKFLYINPSTLDYKFKL